MAGSESLVSREASSLLSLAWSKILPKVADFVANRSIGEFEFVQHDDVWGGWRRVWAGAAMIPYGDYRTGAGVEMVVPGVEGDLAAREQLDLPQ